MEALPDTEGWRICNVIPIPSLPYLTVGTTYTLLQMRDPEVVTGSFSATLKFKVKDVDPATGQPESDECYDDTFVVSYATFW